MNKFEIVSGQKNENELNNQKYAGVSYYKEDEDFFRLQLNIFPNISYFVRKNRSNDGYTIFSKMIKTSEGVNFQNPVGYARVLEKIRTHMHLKFDVLNISLFMSLFPST